jgi:hypothetical protein
LIPGHEIVGHQLAVLHEKARTAIFVISRKRSIQDTARR